MPTTLLLATLPPFLDLPTGLYVIAFFCFHHTIMAGVRFDALTAHLSWLPRSSTPLPHCNHGEFLVRFKVVHAKYSRHFFSVCLIAAKEYLKQYFFTYQVFCEKNVPQISSNMCMENYYLDDKFYHIQKLIDVKSSLPEKPVHF